MPVGCSANIRVSEELDEANRAYLIRHGVRSDDTETLAGVAAWRPGVEAEAEPHENNAGVAPAGSEADVEWIADEDPGSSASPSVSRTATPEEGYDTDRTCLTSDSESA